MSYRAVSVAALVLLASPIAAHAARHELGLMSGSFVSPEGRVFNGTLDLSAQNRDCSTTDGDYLFDISVTDDGRKPSLYGVSLYDPSTKQVYAVQSFATPQTSLHLKAVVSGSEFIGDGGLSWKVYTSQVGDSVRAAMDESQARLIVSLGDVADGGAVTNRDVLYKMVDAPAAAGDKLSVSGPSAGYALAVPGMARAADLKAVPGWQPKSEASDPNAPATDTAPTAAPPGRLAWVHDVKTYVRRVTLRYSTRKSSDSLIKQRGFDIPVTEYGPLHLVDARQAYALPTESPQPPISTPNVTASVTGLFFTSPTGAPEQRILQADQPSKAAGGLIPMAGEDAIVVTIDPMTMRNTVAAEWTAPGDPSSGTTVQSVTSDRLTIPIPAAPDAGPVMVTLRETDSSVIKKTVYLPQGVDWTRPESVPLNFAILDGIDRLDATLRTSGAWPKYTSVANTPFVFIAETDRYPSMVLLPKAMSADDKARILGVVTTHKPQAYVGRTWGEWGKDFDVYPVLLDSPKALFGALRPELQEAANIGFTGNIGGVICSTEFIRLLPVLPGLPPLTGDDLADPIGVAGHEAFHAFMTNFEIAKLAQRGRKVQLSKTRAMSDNSTARGLMNMFDLDRALDKSGYVKAVQTFVAAVNATDTPTRRKLIREACALRADALKRLDKGAARFLTLEEDTEGTATYAGLKVEAALSGSPITLENRLPGGFGPIHDVPVTGRMPLFYQMGYLMCLALDEVQPGWQSDWMENDKSMPQMLEEAVATMSLGNASSPAKPL